MEKTFDSGNLEHLDTSSLLESTPTAVCSRCGKEHFIDELHSVPEMEKYARRMALHSLGLCPAPQIPDEQELIEKYGYGIKSVFCSECLDTLLNSLS